MEWKVAVDALQTGAAIGAAMFAAFAWRASIAAIRGSHRPLLRPVAVRGRTEFLLKNYGSGPALSVLLYEPPVHESSGPVAELDMIEPLGEALGPDFKEKDRVGRRLIEFRGGHTLKERVEYRLLYQDLEGAWHETAFSVSAADEGIYRFEATYYGREDNWKKSRWRQRSGRVVPCSTTLHAQVVSVSTEE